MRVSVLWLAGAIFNLFMVATKICLMFARGPEGVFDIVAFHLWLACYAFSTALCLRLAFGWKSPERAPLVVGGEPQ